MNLRNKLNILLNRGGTGNTERLLPELVETDHLISYKSFSDHVLFLYLYTDILLYYDLDNKPIKANVWRKFLESDRTVVRSLIIHTNIYTLKQNIFKQFLKLRTQNVESISSSHFYSMLGFAKDLMILLNYWHKNLDGDDVIRTTMDSIVNDVLNARLSRLYTLLQIYHNRSDDQLFLEFCQFIEWQCQNTSLWMMNLEQSKEDLSESSVDHETLLGAMHDFFDGIFNTITQLKDLAQGDYDITLNQQDKEPHIALLFAFLQLLKYADQHLNRIPKRTLDHYYRHILKFDNNPSVPDQAHVHFVINPNNDFINIPKGKRLLAQDPATGQDIYFETTQDIIANTAGLNKVNTFFAQSVPNGQSFYNSLSILSKTFGQAELQSLPFQLFPYVEDAKNDRWYMQLSTIIASPLFFLSEGRRTIHISGAITAECTQRLQRDAETWQVQNPDYKQTYSEYLVATIHDLFDIYITTKTGWIPVPAKQVNFKFIDDLRAFGVDIILTEDTPAIDALPEDDPKDVFKLRVPMIVLGVRNSTKFNNVLSLLVLERIDLKVRVENYRNLILQNHLGIIDNSQVIEPFGPLPRIDTSFYIGSGEIFSKNLTDLKIHIRWDNLPNSTGGFSSYYGAYPTKISNDDFKVRISYLNYQHWNPFHRQNRQVFPLFTLKDPEDPNHSTLDDKRNIDHINLHVLRINKANEPLDITSYNHKSISGFLKLQLDGPEQAFGHAIYPTLMSEILLKNTRLKKKEKPIVLNAPYTPRIKSITVDYEAEESFDLSQPIGEDEKHANSFIHITPFGYTKIFPKIADAPATLFPYVDEGKSYIALGITSCHGSSLSLHIQIDENRLHPEEDIQRPSWSYLSNNIWLPIHEEHIVMDSTNGCYQSGIIMFNLPTDIVKNNTCMEPGLLWLKAEFSGSRDSLPAITGIYTQAVMVSRVMDQNGIAASPVLPARSIQQLEDSIDGVEAIEQPFPTFNGRQFETHQAFYRRVSERLKHKNRTISALDYERIILQQFPGISRVYCINHTQKSQNNMARPGHITLVIIAKTEKNSLDQLPVIGRSLLLDIKSYVQKLSSPFIHFEVVNPVYEDVRVSIAVKFKPQYEQGLYINILQNDIRNFISPWLSNPLENIQLGGSIPTSNIIDFIKNLYYIEGIGNFTILKHIGRGPNLILDRVDNYNSRLYASYPWSILISAKQHNISVVDNLDHVIKLRHGSIDDMAIGEDFMIGPWDTQKHLGMGKHTDEVKPIWDAEHYYLITKKNVHNHNIHDNHN